MSETAGNRGQPPSDGAEGWLDEKTRHADGRAKGLEDVEGTPTVDDLRRQQHREMRHVGLGTESQFKGAVFGTVVGGVIGALVGLVIGRFLLSDLDTGVRVTLPMVLGAAAGARSEEHTSELQSLMR